MQVSYGAPVWGVLLRFWSDFDRILITAADLEATDEKQIEILLALEIEKIMYNYVPIFF